VDAIQSNAWLSILFFCFCVDILQAACHTQTERRGNTNNSPIEGTQEIRLDATQKIILITGGSSGIGKATAARLLTNPNITVVVCGRSLDKLESAIAELEPDGARFAAIQADVSVPEDVTRLVSSVQSKFGGVDVLVNCAGKGYLGGFPETTPELMDALWNANVKSAMLTAQAVLPAMMERKSGHIINLCGVLGVKTIANAALYCAVKHALVGFGNSLAAEVKRSGIRVSNLCCSGVDTPFWDGIAGKPRTELLLKPEDVADEIVHLISQPAYVITGSVLMQHVAHQL